MDDFEYQGTLDDGEVEIIDLDPIRGRSRIAVLWLYPQHLRSRVRLRMSLLPVVGVVFLAVMLLSSLPMQLSHPSEKAPGNLTTSASPQENSCISLVFVPNTNNVTVLSDSVQWSTLKAVPSVKGASGGSTVVASCADIQILPTGPKSTHRHTQK